MHQPAEIPSTLCYLLVYVHIYYYILIYDIQWNIYILDYIKHILHYIFYYLLRNHNISPTRISPWKTGGNFPDTKLPLEEKSVLSEVTSFWKRLPFPLGCWMDDVPFLVPIHAYTICISYRHIDIYNSLKVQTRPYNYAYRFSIAFHYIDVLDMYL